ncbi:unnamed protein product, partial [marine sediment metagenome]
MFGKTDAKQNVNYYFQKIIDKFTQKGSISTAKGYENALQCLLRFHKKENISFNDVNVSFLQEFENFCIKMEDKSITTVSIYTRNLRAVFNEAIANNTITNDSYPFGKRKYQIKAPKKVKKALTPQQIKILFEGVPKTLQQEKAK